MTDLASNPFLAGVDPEVLKGLEPKPARPERTLEQVYPHPSKQPFGVLEEIKAAEPVTWWHHLCCWHSSRWYADMKNDVRDKWGNPDPETPEKTYDTTAEADARAKELNGSDAYCIRQPLPKEDR